MLARANARANLRRTASVATPLMLAIALIATIFFGKSALQHRTTEQTEQRVTATHVVRADGAPGLPPGLARTIRRLPGVASASGTIATSVVVSADGDNLRLLGARGVDPSTLAGVLDLGVDSGSVAALKGDAIAVGTSTARSLGWHLGDRVRLSLGDGTPAVLRVVATYERPLGFGDVALPRALVARHVDAPLDDAVFVKGSGDALERLVDGQPAAKLLTRDEYREDLHAVTAQDSLAIYVLLGVIGIFCALALVNAITMATADRAREFALLRLVGASRRQVRTMVRAETLIMVVFGLAIGSLVAAPALAVYQHSLTGSAVPSIPLKAYGVLLGVYALLGFLATVLPTRLALRMNPVKAMAARE
jgi:putative ABC transport system permease protein